jgi:hypothetical protein
MRQHLVNHLLYGSCDGPAIEIDWEERAFTLSRMSARRTLRVLRWISAGNRDRLRREAAEAREAARLAGEDLG